MGGRGASSSVGKGVSSGKSGSAGTQRQLDKINELARGTGGRTEMETMLNGMKTGTEFSLLKTTNGLVDSYTTLKKTGKDSWTSNNGVNATKKVSTSDIIRRLKNNGGNLVTGGIDTSSHVKITGRQRKAADGLTYAKGTYDILMGGVSAGKSGRRKTEVSGRITSYNGNQYGVAKTTGGYNITHLKTGLLVNYGAVKRGDVANTIKEADKIFKQNSRRFEQAEDEFKRTRRG